MRRLAAPQTGFSLVELITVIVVLAVVATVGTGFIVSATESYQRTQTRAALVNTARQALERMTRQLRGAMPYSVRITNSGECVQFMPIAAGGVYRNDVPDQANKALLSVSPHNEILTYPFSVDTTYTPRYLAIGAKGSGELYAPDNHALGTLSTGLNPEESPFTRLSFFTKTTAWPRNSVSHRFFLLDSPQAFCVFDGELRFYPDQDVTGDSIEIGRPFDLLARNAQAVGSPFVLSAASDSRNVLLAINLAFSEGGETLTFEQEVLIRNVP